MNRFTKAALIAAGAALGTQAARAQFANGDLILGFTEPGAQNDYVLNLGDNASVVGVGGNSVVDLSSQFSGSTFNTAFPGGLSGVSMGVVGGSIAFAGSYNFETALRSGVGTPSVAGSTTPAGITQANGKSGLQIVVALNNSMNLAPGQSGTVPQGGNSSGYSWFNNVSSPTSTGGSYLQSTAYNPNAVASGNVIREDLYESNPASSGGTYNFAYEGYFTLDMSGANPSLTFTPATAAVPEPNTYGLLAGAGLLALCLRLQFSQKAA